MTNKMVLMALGLSVALLSGCGSSSDNDGTDTTTADTATTATDATTTTDTTAATTASIGFTPELLVGKTYVILAEVEVNASFTDTVVNFTEEGESGSSPYVIDANGVLIVDHADEPEPYPFTLVSIESNGNLNVIDDEGDQVIWVLM